MIVCYPPKHIGVRSTFMSFYFFASSFSAGRYFSMNSFT